MSSLASTSVVHHLTEQDTRWSEVLRVRDQFVASLPAISPISVKEIMAMSQPALPIEIDEPLAVGGVR